LGVLFAVNSLSQSDSTRGRTGDWRYFSYTYSNDFFNETDRYFTQEIHPELVLPVFRKLPFMKLLLQLRGATLRYGLSATQDCFTPASIRRDTILRGDRPYSGTIFLSHFKVSNQEEKKQRLTAQIDLGAMGPCAKCEEEQKGIHKMLVNIQPLGWEFQISNDLYLNYRLRYEKGIFGLRYIDLGGIGEINAGTVYNNATVGLTLRFGKMRPYFENSRSKKFQFYGFAQGWIKGVAYNATLQGGPFSKSIYVLGAPEISPVVLRGDFGARFSYKEIGIEFCRVFITREIRTWWSHGWGYISIIAYF